MDIVNLTEYLSGIRAELISEIQKLWPEECCSYNRAHLPYCNSIKCIGEHYKREDEFLGEICCYEPIRTSNYLTPSYVSDLPIESLVVLLEELRKPGTWYPR